MKTFSVLFLLSFLSSVAYGQKVFDFFKSLPDESVFGLTVEQRKQVIQDYRDKKTEPSKESGYFWFTEADPRNGYLRLGGGVDGHFEMCYWNLSNGDKLVGVYTEVCATICDMGSIEFFRVSNG